MTRAGIHAIAASPLDAVIALLDELIDDEHEIVTLLVGLDASTDDTKCVQAYLADAHPHVEVEVHEGGQPLYPYLVGVE